MYSIHCKMFSWLFSLLFKSRMPFFFVILLFNDSANWCTQSRRDMMTLHYLFWLSIFYSSTSSLSLLLKIIMNHFIGSCFPLQKHLVGPSERLQQVVSGVQSIQPLDWAANVSRVFAPCCSSSPPHSMISFLLLSRHHPLLHSALKCARRCLPWAVIVCLSKSTRSVINNDNNTANLPHS